MSYMYLDSPEGVRIQGSGVLREGEELPLLCESAASVPEASLTWRIHQAGQTVEPRIAQVRLWRMDSGISNFFYNTVFYNNCF